MQPRGCRLGKASRALLLLAMLAAAAPSVSARMQLLGDDSDSSSAIASASGSMALTLDSGSNKLHSKLDSHLDDKRDMLHSKLDGSLDGLHASKHVDASISSPLLSMHASKTHKTNKKHNEKSDLPVAIHLDKQKDTHMEKHIDVPAAAAAAPELHTAIPSLPNPSNPPSFNPNPSNPPTLNPNPSQPPTFNPNPSHPPHQYTADLPAPKPTKAKHGKDKTTDPAKLQAKMQAKLAKQAAQLAKLAAKPSKDEEPAGPATLPPMPLDKSDHDTPEHMGEKALHHKMPKLHDSDHKDGKMSMHKPSILLKVLPPPEQQHINAPLTAANPSSIPAGPLPMSQTLDNSHKRMLTGHGMPDLQGNDLVINMRGKAGQQPSVSIEPHQPTPPLPAGANGYAWLDRVYKRSFFDILSPEMVAAMMPTAPLGRWR